MPCNANNHAPDCNCGWGGTFHSPEALLGEADWTKPSSYTTPNARCPHCGESVFFYRSPHNGAVYFDDLGPPWPKHPCTDPDAGSAHPLRTSAKAGWWPLLREAGPFATHQLPGGEGVLIWNDKERGLLIQGSYKVLRERVPVWMRRIAGRPRCYQVSTLKTAKGKTYEATYAAFTGEALLDPEVARHFQKSIAWINSITNPEAKAG